MNIVNGLHERITDFENILEATKGKSYNEAFKWRGKNYNSFKELLNEEIRKILKEKRRDRKCG